VSIIAPADATKVKSFLQDNLRDPVTVELFSQKKSPLVVPGRTECEYCEETEQLLGEVAEMSDKVRLTVHDVRATPDAGAAYGIQPDMVPAIVLRGENKGTLRYFGIPAGYEFTGFLQNLADVSTGSTKLSEPTKEELTKLRADVHIRVFVTPT
jgi:alkyl hydroperoxide reductase subunit AhpF